MATFVKFVQLLQNQFRPSSYPILVIDHFCCHFMVSTILRISLIQVGGAILVSAAFTSHLKERHSMIGKSMQCITNPNAANSSSLKSQVKMRYITVLLGHFLHEHAYVCRQVLQLNEHLWSHNLFYSCIPHMVSNVYFFYRLIYQHRHLSPVEISIIMAVLLLQLLLLGSAMLPLARMSKVIHGCYRNIPAYQKCLSINLIMVKLKYQTLYERVASQNFTYGFTIGKTDKTLNIRTIFEVI